MPLDTTMKFIDPRNDRWQLGSADTPRGADVHDLASWHDVRRDWPAGREAALIVPNDADLESLEPDLPRFALIALQFPKWTDGRAYSQARLLRVRHAYRGEVRAIGEVLVDMLPLLQRTGFDAVQLRADQSLESAQRALRFFAGGHYQGDVQEPRPLHARTATSTLFNRVPA